NAGVCGDRRAGRNSGHDFPFDSGLNQRLGLLAAAAKDERVAALQTHDDRMFIGLRDEQAVDLRLRPQLLGTLEPALADVDQFGAGGRMFENLRVDQVVVDHAVGFGDQIARLEREQARIARPRADQINLAGSVLIEFHNAAFAFSAAALECRAEAIRFNSSSLARIFAALSSTVSRSVSTTSSGSLGSS